MSLKLQEVMNLMDELAPPHLSLGDDPVGLQIGDPGQEITNIITALDVNEAVLTEALQRDANLIVSHHPLLFSPLKSINYKNPGGALLKQLIKNEINVFSAHTNLDVAPKGVNSVLSGMFGLQKPEILEITSYDPLLKLVVFVPEGHEDKVRGALAEAGAGWIGNYSSCTFQVLGTGTFFPHEGSSPFIGSEGKLEKVAEFRLETIFRESHKKAVISALLQSHPYEEPAYDLYLLKNEGYPLGLGYIGSLKKPVSFREFIKNSCEILNVEVVRGFGHEDRLIQKVALCGGSGGSLIKAALIKKADVFLSGDFKYHDISFALSEGLALADAGHFATEYPVVPYLAWYLGDKLKARGYRTKIWPASPGMEQKRIIFS